MNVDPRMLSADEVRLIQERKRPPCFENGGYPSVKALCEYADLTRTDIPNLCYTVERMRADAEIARLAREWAEAFQRCDDPNHTDEYREARAALIAAVEQEGR